MRGALSRRMVFRLLSLLSLTVVLTVGAPIAAPALGAARAAAQSCGPPAESSSSSDSSGSDDSSSSNSGGSTSDSSDSDWGDSGSSSSSSGSLVTVKPACTDRTDLTGYEQCTRFGASWDAAAPALRFELGPSFRRLSLGGINLGGVTYHDGNPHRFTLNTDDLDEPSVLAGGLNLRFTVPLFDNFLVGAELDASFGGAPGGEASDGDLTLRITDVNSFGGGVVAGVVIPVGPFRLRGEVLAGGQAVTVTTASHLGDCVSEATDVTTRFVVEPRVGIEFFVGRHLSFDVWGGADVVNPGSFGGGLRLNLHTRAYDGVR